MSEDGNASEFEALFGNAPCGYVVVSIDGRIARINSTLTNWLGRSAQELTDLPFTQILSFGGRIAFETHLTPMLRLQGQIDEIALDLVASNGAKVPVIANAAVKRDEAGKPLQTWVTLFKAADRRKYERGLIAARDEAEAASLASHETAVLREQFIAVLGHDLRNPVAALDAGSRLLSSEELSERGKFVLRQMGQSVARASSLIDNILDFARGRLGEGLILERNRDEPLNPVLEQVVAEVSAIYPDRKIETSFIVDDPIYCDRQRIAQLFANLLSNAIAHGAPDLPIEVEARSDGQFTLAVRNGGDPIPDDAREKLFEPFFRGGSQRSQQGLGLGLFIVSEIAKAHGGSMDVTSNSNETSFVLSIPTV